LEKTLVNHIETEDEEDSDSSSKTGQSSAHKGGTVDTKPVKNYMTPKGYTAMRDELLAIMDVERPKIVEIVHWAASNGDRSENGDYIYGKKRLREIDRRIRFLTKRLDIAEVVDPSVHYNNDTVFFGATVTYCTVHPSPQSSADQDNTITILGVDEFDSLKGEVSWVSPIARALIRAREGDEVKLQTPAGTQVIEILKVEYPKP
jgi:transcription elongation factor GreB